jgi:hypothetical protein
MNYTSVVMSVYDGAVSAVSVISKNNFKTIAKDLMSLVDEGGELNG